jgi:hypothetical protein
MGRPPNPSLKFEGKWRRRSSSNIDWSTPVGNEGETIGSALLAALSAKVRLKQTPAQVDQVLSLQQRLFKSQNAKTASYFPASWRQFKKVMQITQFFLLAFYFVDFCDRCCRPFPFKGDAQTAPPIPDEVCPHGDCGGKRYRNARGNPKPACRTYYVRFSFYGTMMMNNPRYVAGVQRWRSKILADMTDAETSDVNSYYGSYHFKKTVGLNPGPLAARVRDNPFSMYLVLMVDGMAMFNHNSISTKLSIEITAVKNHTAGEHFARRTESTTPVAFNVVRDFPGGTPLTFALQQMVPLLDDFAPDNNAAVASAPLGGGVVEFSATIVNLLADGPATNASAGTRSPAASGGSCLMLKNTGKSVVGKAGSKKKKKKKTDANGEPVGYTHATTKYLCDYATALEWETRTEAEFLSDLARVEAASTAAGLEAALKAGSRRCSGYVLLGDPALTPAFGEGGLRPYGLHVPQTWPIPGMFHQQATNLKAILAAVGKLRGVKESVATRMRNLRPSTVLSSYGDSADAHEHMSCEMLMEFTLFLLPITWMPALLENGHEDWWHMLACMHVVMMLCNKNGHEIALLPLMVAFTRQYLARRQALMGEASMTWAGFSALMFVFSAFIHNGIYSHNELGIDEAGRVYVRGAFMFGGVRGGINSCCCQCTNRCFTSINSCCSSIITGALPVLTVAVPVSTAVPPVSTVAAPVSTLVSPVSTAAALHQYQQLLLQYQQQLRRYQLQLLQCQQFYPYLLLKHLSDPAPRRNRNTDPLPNRKPEPNPSPHSCGC